MAGSGSAIKEGDLAPMCFQLIDFQIVVKALAPGPCQPHRTLGETDTKKGKTIRFFLHLVEQVLEISNEFISGFKAVIEFAINPSIRIREHRHCTPKQHDLLLLNTNR